MKIDKNLRIRIIEIAIIVVLSCVLFLACNHRSSDYGNEIEITAGSENVSEVAAYTSEESKETATICVYVCGAVNSPGVVELPEGSRVEDALSLAGGFAPGAREDCINLATVLEDGQMIRFPFEGEDAETIDDYTGEERDGRVNINKASIQELMTIPGVGESRAKAIVEYRETNGAFETPEDLMKVPGIKEGIFAKMKDYVKVK